MTHQRTQIQLSPEEQQLHDSIAVLSGEEARLKGEISLRLKDLEGYDTLLPRYKEQQILLESITSHIKEKRALLESTSTEYDVIFNKLTVLKKEFDSLEPLVEERRKLTSEIDTLTKNFGILQKDMEMFQNNHSENKKIAQTELDGIKEQIRKLHSLVGDIVNKL